MAGLKLQFLKTLIEVPVFCALFSMFVQNSVYTNLVLYRSCYVDLGYNKSECALIGTGIKNNLTDHLQKMVEPHANSVMLYIQLPVGIVCAILGLFVGSWSDRNGRKSVLIATVGGQAVSFVVVAIYCILPKLSPWYLVTSAVPVILTGGFSAMLTIFLSYVSDITDEHNRGVRLGIFEVTFSAASLLGTFTSSYIFKFIGYVGIYATAAGFSTIGTLFIIIFIEESLSESQIETYRQQTQPSFKEQLKEMTKTALRKRPHHGRAIIILGIIITSMFVFALLSDIGIIQLFLQLKFGWSLQKFNVFSSSREFLCILGTFFGVYGLHNKLNVNETVLVLIGLISSFSSALVQGLATVDIHIYFAGALRLLSGCVNPMIRSLISKIAQPNEVGKIFAVAVMCQSVLQLIGSPLYTEVYNRSLSVWPSLYNFITAAIFFIGIILTIVVMILRYKAPASISFEALDEDIVISSASNDETNEPSPLF